jgi:hypothetical protein
VKKSEKGNQKQLKSRRLLKKQAIVKNVKKAGDQKNLPTFYQVENRMKHKYISFKKKSYETQIF